MAQPTVASAPVRHLDLSLVLLRLGIALFLLGNHDTLLNLDAMRTKARA